MENNFSAINDKLANFSINFEAFQKETNEKSLNIEQKLEEEASTNTCDQLSEQLDDIESKLNFLYERPSSRVTIFSPPKRRTPFEWNLLTASSWNFLQFNSFCMKFINRKRSSPKIEVFPPPPPKKKGLCRKLKCFFPEIRWRPKNLYTKRQLEWTCFISSKCRKEGHLGIF